MSPKRRSRGIQYGGSRSSGNAHANVISGGVAREKKKRRDKNVDREGYAPCTVCGYWIRVRIDGGLYGHTSDGKGRNFGGRGIPCLGARPTIGNEWTQRQGDAS